MAGAYSSIHLGNMIFVMKQPIKLPHYVSRYVGLSEITIPNSEYKINETNNTLVMNGTPFTKRVGLVYSNSSFSKSSTN